MSFGLCGLRREQLAPSLDITSIAAFPAVL
jgi:hypothetical protein